MTRSRHGTPDPFDLAALHRSGELLDALSERRTVASGDDPAVRLLAALAADVDADTPPVGRAGDPEGAGSAEGDAEDEGTERSGGGPARGRRGARVFVAFGVASAVLATTGVAAASGVVSQVIGAPERHESVQRSNQALRQARAAVEHGRYDTARASLALAQREREEISGQDAAEIDREIRLIEARLAVARPNPSTDVGPPRASSSPTTERTPPSPEPSVVDPSETSGATPTPLGYGSSAPEETPPVNLSAEDHPGPHQGESPAPAPDASPDADEDDH